MAAPDLSNNHRDTLKKIFAHPVSHNVEWQDVIGLLGAVGDIEERKSNYAVTLEAARPRCCTGTEAPRAGRRRSAAPAQAAGQPRHRARLTPPAAPADPGLTPQVTGMSGPGPGSPDGCQTSPTTASCPTARPRRWSPGTGRSTGGACPGSTRRRCSAGCWTRAPGTGRCARCRGSDVRRGYETTRWCCGRSTARPRARSRSPTRWPSRPAPAGTSIGLRSPRRWSAGSRGCAGPYGWRRSRPAAGVRPDRAALAHRRRRRRGPRRPGDADLHRRRSDWTLAGGRPGPGSRSRPGRRWSCG